MTDESKLLYTHALDKWGVQAQMEMIVEECSELILAIQKYKRNPSEANRKNIIEELADVTIMCEQGSFIMGEDKVDAWKETKLNRIKQTLEDDRTII